LGAVSVKAQRMRKLALEVSIAVTSRESATRTSTVPETASGHRNDG
jgi:hypothetical protein